MIQLTRPRFMVPIHGEYRYLARHAAMAREQGVEDTRILENGSVLSLWKDAASVTGRVQAGRVIVDGKGIDEERSEALQDRRKLAAAGLVVAWLILDASSGEVVHGPRLLSHGVIGVGEDETVLDDASREALEAIQKLSPASRREAAEVGEAVRLAVRRVFNRRWETKPMVIPIVHEL
jgi:ribonuclease J